MSPDSPIYSIGAFKNAESPIKWRIKDNSRKRSFDDHLRVISSYCKSKATIYENTYKGRSEIKLTPNHCNSWDCPVCRDRKSFLLKSRIKRGIRSDKWRLLTLTINPDLMTRDESILKFSQLWDVFIKRVRRIHPDIRWVRVVEFTGRGYPHAHVILNKFLSIKWINEIWSGLGGGYINDIRFIKTRRVASYVSHYVSGGHDKHNEFNYQYYTFGVRRYNFSRNFPVAKWEKRTVVYFNCFDYECAGCLYNFSINYLLSQNAFIALKTPTNMKFISKEDFNNKIVMC